MIINEKRRRANDVKQALVGRHPNFVSNFLFLCILDVGVIVHNQTIQNRSQKRKQKPELTSLARRVKVLAMASNMVFDCVDYQNARHDE